MHHSVTFHFGSATVCSPDIFGTFVSYNKDIWIAATYYYMYFFFLQNCALDIFFLLDVIFSA